MNRLSVPVIALVLLAAGCTKNSTSPTTNTTAPANPTFTAALSPANEVPPVTNAESGVSGTANITSATVTFAVTLGGFPAGSAINIAHIHEGASTCACPVVVNTTLAAGDVTVANGLASFTKTVPVDAALAQRIINGPSGFYFNVHSTLNPGGVARGTLVKLG